jgi:hypothetical protein
MSDFGDSRQGSGFRDRHRRPRAAIDHAGRCLQCTSDLPEDLEIAGEVIMPRKICDRLPHPFSGLKIDAYRKLAQEAKATSSCGSLSLCLCQAQADQIVRNRPIDKNGGQSRC